uniref:Uncharacterized protein n=1 Tax=Brassica campestris TaxID=3711 RepID=A0A3P6C6J1_BRACM|nr:unnamed protein product [Brassica rapa]
MMLEDLRVQAKWAALPEVAKLLPLPNFCNMFLQSRPIAWHVNRDGPIRLPFMCFFSVRSLRRKG